MRYPNLVEFEVFGDYGLFTDPIFRVGGEKCTYQVRAHFEWNENRPELSGDRNENKHHEMAKRMIRKGGRRDIFLGTRECQGYVEPCTFGAGEGFYDTLSELSFGLMYHGITYADESYSPETRDAMTARFWYPVMKRGIITFPKPEDCSIQKYLRKMPIKSFGEGNFSGLQEFGEVT